MNLGHSMAAELEQESAATRRMLEAIPSDRLDWKPHEKSMSLGQLALHLASAPGQVAEMLRYDTVPPPDFGNIPSPETKQEVLDAHEDGLGTARQVLESMDDEEFSKTWRVEDGDTELMSMPKAGLARAILLNHVYHHRGQLSVYLRMLGEPVPATYGVSADENPFAA